MGKRHTYQPSQETNIAFFTCFAGYIVFPDLLFLFGVQLYNPLLIVELGICLLPVRTGLGVFQVFQAADTCFFAGCGVERVFAGQCGTQGHIGFFEFYN